MKITILLYIFLHTLGLSANIQVCADCKTKSIAEAVKQAQPGETITLIGNFTESNIIIDKPLNIIGKNNPIIKAKDGKEVFTITTNNVVIKDITIRDMKTSYTEDRAAIKVKHSENIYIDNITLINTFFGIYLAKSKNCIIKNNKITGDAKTQTSSANGIHLWSCENILIENNIVERHRDGIYFEFVKNSLIKKNISKYNLRYGLHFMFSDDDKYYNNRFQHNGAGVAVMYSKNIEMFKNDFIENWGINSNGLLLKDIKDSKISNNYFHKNTVGIHGESVIRCHFENNDIVENGWAVKFVSSSEQNTFTYNNFITNTFDIVTNKNAINRNKYYRNYWTAYNGYDLNKDGIGDKPHHPVELFSSVISQSPSSIVLLRSLFVDLMNFAEKVVPMLTTQDLKDEEPLMKEISHD